MKKIFSILFAVVVSTGLFASKGMVITQTYTDAANRDAKITVTWYVSQTQCKMSMAYADGKVNSTTFFIPDGANLLTYSDGIAPGAAQKNYFSIPVQSITGNSDISRVTVTHSGETKTLGGVLCEKVIIKTNKTLTEMWLTSDFKPDFYKFSPFFQNSIELMGLNQEALQGVPLESVTKDNGGVVIGSYTLVSAQSTELGTGDFMVPSDYKNAAGTTK
jgi:hypothetical protein